MTLPVPDHSPAMLRAFLTVRVQVRRDRHRETEKQAARAVSAVVRRDSGVTVAEFDAALKGEPQPPHRLARIWSALGVDVDIGAGVGGADK